MKKIALIVLIMCSLALAEEVTLNRAMAIAQNTLPGMGVVPSSKPAYPADTNTTQAWIIEFDSVWVPIDKNTGEVISTEKEAKKIFTIHYEIQKILEQNTKDNYPTKKRAGLNIMLSDVKVKKNFVTTYKPQMPTGADDLTDLETGLNEVEASLSNAISLITDVEASEEGLKTKTSNQKDYEEWKNKFKALVGEIKNIATTGYVYDTAANEYINTANDYIAGEYNTTDKQTVTAFANGLAVTGIPSDLAGLENSVEEWEEKWLLTGLSEEKIIEDVDAIYLMFLEKIGEITIEAMQTQAYEKVQVLDETAAPIITKLEVCYKDLSVKNQGDLDGLKETLELARNAYNKGATSEKEFDFETAKQEYQNAIEYTGDAEEYSSNLENVKCPNTKPEQKTPIEIITAFAFSPGGGVVILLIAALIAITFLKKKTPEVQYDDDYY